MLRSVFIPFAVCLLLFSIAHAGDLNVAGRILTEKGPLKDGQVHIYRSYAEIQTGKPVYTSAPADEQGSYSTQLPPGDYFFVARGKKDGRDYFAYHGNNPIRIDSGKTWVTLLALESKPPAYSEGDSALKGVVTFKGQPVKGAYVSLYKPEATRFKGLGFRTESVAQDGSFNMAMPEGKYVVVAKSIESRKGNRPLKTGDLYCYYPDNPVEVRSDSGTTIEIPCYPKEDRTSFVNTPAIRPNSFQTIETQAAGRKAGIRGKITDSKGKPVKGILVLAYPATKPVFLTYHLSHGTEYSAETAADGSYFIPLDKTGDYYLVARDTLGDGPHRGELYGLYNGNSRHVVTFEQGKEVDNIQISVSRIIDEPMQNRGTAAVAAEKAADNSRQVTVVTDQVISVDTTWKGEINVQGVVVVKKGATLTILPETRVAFSHIDRDNNGVGDGELRIEGRVIARGTAEKPIVFTSAAPAPRTKDWSYVHLLASQADNEFSFCRFEYGFSGIQVHYSKVTISDCVFNNNLEGLHFNTADVVADHNTFINNGTAIRFKRLEGRISVSNNDVHDNEIGVLFGRQQINAVDFKALNKPVEFPLFVGNNFHNNQKYNFSMGEGQNLDINVANNWWGAALDAKIVESIFDKTSDSALGKVVYIPFLQAPVSQAGSHKATKDESR